MSRFILLSKGLNTRIGRNLISKAIGEEDKTNKRILLITMEDYGINNLLMDVVLEMGFERQNILIFDGASLTKADGHFDYIYVSEGNTFELFYMIRRYGLVGIILDCVERGTTYIGASAGAVIASTDIFLAKDFDRNFVGMTDFTGLGFVDGIVLPHLTEEGLARYLETVPEYLQKRYHKIYQISEEVLWSFEN